MTINTVRKAIAEAVDVAPELITEDSVLADLGVDSLTAAMLLFDLEEDVGVTIDTNTPPVTVGDLVKMIDLAKAANT